MMKRICIFVVLMLFSYAMVNYSVLTSISPAFASIVVNNNTKATVDPSITIRNTSSNVHQYIPELDSFTPSHWQLCDTTVRSPLLPEIQLKPPCFNLLNTLSKSDPFGTMSTLDLSTDPKEYSYIFDRKWPEQEWPLYFYAIASIAVDASGNVYITDSYKNRVVKFALDGTYLTQWGSYGTGSGQFVAPSGVAVDTSGNVYIGDGSHRIQKFTSTGIFLSQWGEQTTDNILFGVAVDASGNVYVADPYNYRILKYTSEGTYITQWGGQGTENGQFNWVADVTVDNVGDVYVADRNNFRIQKFTTDGTYVTQWGIRGTDNGQFDYPCGIAVDGAGRIYVKDLTNRVQIFNSSGTLLSLLRDTGISTTSSLDDVIVDGLGNVHIAYPYGYCIRTLTADGTFLSQWGNAEMAGGQFYSPTGIALNAVGSIYVVDKYNDRVQMFNSNGDFLLEWGSAGVGNGQFEYPCDVTADRYGNIFIADGGNNRIQKFASDGTYLTQWGGYGTGDGQFNWPNGITADIGGNVYVVDTNNHRIQKFSSEGEFLIKWGNNGLSDGQFDSPCGIAIDSANNVYVADSFNERIQKFTSDGNFITKWGSWGTGNGQFEQVRNVGVDTSGNVYVSDFGNNRIQKFTSAGAFLTKWGSAGSGDGQFDHPCGIAVDTVGNVYVADSYNDRIQKFRPFSNGVTPEISFFAINAGVISTANPSVTLNNVCTGNPTEYIVSELDSFSGAEWLPYSTAPTFTLSPEIGTKRIYFKVRNASGESSLVMDQIFLIDRTTLAVSSIAPRVGSTAGGTEVTITGRGFTDDITVLFGTIPARSIALSSEMQMTVVSPAHTAGIVNVTVGRSPSVTLPDAFLYTEANTVSGAVQDSVTGEVLTGVTCTIFDAETSAQLGSATTDTSGRFAITVPSLLQKLRLQVSTSNYDTRIIENFYAPMLFNILLSQLKPQSPTGLVVLPGTDQMMLYWTANLESDLAGYTVYRNGVIIAENIKTPYYLDTAGILSGTAYTYRVVAVDTTGHQSDPVTSSSVVAGEIELWLPNTAGLPNDPADGVWMPINISNARHISPVSLSLQVTYDATLIDASRVHVEPTGITSEVPFTANTATPGIITITSTAPAGSDALSGEGNLFSLFLPIRTGLTSGRASVTISAFQAFSATGGIIPVSQINRPGWIIINTIGRLGDINRDGIINHADITAGFDIILGRNTSPATVQQDALDLSGDRRLDAADIVLLNRIVAGQPVYPSQPGKAYDHRKIEPSLKTLRKANQTVTVTVPPSEAAAGALVEVPVTLDHAEGLSGVGLTIAYPPQLTLESLNGVSTGTLTTNFVLESNSGPSNVQIAMCNLSALPEGNGSVVRLLFRVSPVAQPGETFQIKINDVKLKGPYGESFDWTGTVDSSDGTVTVKGLVELPLIVRLLDKATNTPISDSSLTVRPVSNGGSAIVSSVNPGVFQVLGLTTNTYQFTGQAPGFNNYSETRGVNATEQSQIDLQMTKSGTSGGCYADRIQDTVPIGGNLADLGFLFCVTGVLIAIRRVSIPKNDDVN